MATKKVAPEKIQQLRNLSQKIDDLHISGKDKAVIDYFVGHPVVSDFLTDVFKIIDSAIDNYQARGFTDLMVSFGCTGGQHRSVYCAEKLAEHLEKKNILVQSKHYEFDNWNKK